MGLKRTKKNPPKRGSSLGLGMEAESRNEGKPFLNFPGGNLDFRREGEWVLWNLGSGLCKL